MWRGITDIICISEEPAADLQREGFKKAPYLENSTFTIGSDSEGDLLSIFGEVCEAIDWALDDENGVLVWDIGGGVAAMAGYSKHSIIYALISSTGNPINTRICDSHEKVQRVLARSHDGHNSGETQASKANTSAEPKDNGPATQ